MKLEQYKILISNLPVLQQSYTTKRNSWNKAEDEIEWLKPFNDKLFYNNDTLTISRQDVFDASGSIRELILKTIYWGYPRGMRGNHFIQIMNSIEILEKSLGNLKTITNPTTSNFNEISRDFRQIFGLGLSTYSKFLYFLDIKFNNYHSLILDKKIIDVFASNLFDDFAPLGTINYNNAERKYLDFLEIIDSLAFDLGTSVENIELFLFLFGNILKANYNR